MRRGVSLRHAGLRGDDRDRPAAGRARDPLDELVLARRAALRGVRIVVLGVAQIRPQPPARRHDLQHERDAPLARRRDGVRDARRRRGRAHGVHDVPHLPRPPRARDLARLRPDAGRLVALQALDARSSRAVLRRHLREPQDDLLVADGDPGHARPARRLRRGAPRRARPLRLPAAVAAGQRRALAQVRPARADPLDRGRRRRAVARDGGRRRRPTPSSTSTR